MAIYEKLYLAGLAKRFLKYGGKNMKASLYNILVNAPDGSVVLYTTRTGGMTRFDADERPLIERALCEGTSHQPEIDQVMLSQGHLVEDDFDEKASVRMKRKIGIEDRNRLDICCCQRLTAISGVFIVTKNTGKNTCLMKWQKRSLNF